MMMSDNGGDDEDGDQFISDNIIWTFILRNNGTLDNYYQWHLSVCLSPVLPLTKQSLRVTLTPWCRSHPPSKRGAFY